MTYLSKVLGTALGCFLDTDVQGTWKTALHLAGTSWGAGTMVAAGKVLITFNSIWNTFCGQTHSIKLFHAIRVHWTWCHIMSVPSSFTADLPSTYVVLTTVLFCITTYYSVHLNRLQKTTSIPVYIFKLWSSIEL